MAALAADLAKDARPFRELSPEERSARIERVMGIGRGLISTSEEFAERKAEESRSRNESLSDDRVYVSWYPKPPKSPEGQWQSRPVPPLRAFDS
jgi:hypothetical protein